MTQTRDRILGSIRKHTREQAQHPDIKAFRGINFDDKVGQFAQIISAVGGQLIDMSGRTDYASAVREQYPEAKRFISDLQIEGLECVHPKDEHSPREMNGTDVTILESHLGVCENGCVWIEQTETLRAHLFITENLVFILDRSDLVNNMHEAYEKVKTFNPQSPYSGFISGPSKTADIEQALVMGAHGARGLTILLK